MSAAARTSRGCSSACHISTPSPALLEAVSVRYLVFDLLQLGGEWQLELPYRQHRARLLELELRHAGVVVPANVTDTPGDLVMQAAAELGLEGVVAKR